MPARNGVGVSFRRVIIVRPAALCRSVRRKQPRGYRVNNILLRAGCLAAGLGVSVVCAAAPADDLAKHCDVHAATMVAEMPRSG